MKRDLSLCRELLLLLEEKRQEAIGVWRFPFGDKDLAVGYAPDDVVYDLARMLEAGFFADQSNIAADSPLLMVARLRLDTRSACVENQTHSGEPNRVTLPRLSA